MSNSIVETPLILISTALPGTPLLDEIDTPATLPCKLSEIFPLTPGIPLRRLLVVTVETEPVNMDFF